MKVKPFFYELNSCVLMIDFNHVKNHTFNLEIKIIKIKCNQYRIILVYLSNANKKEHLMTELKGFQQAISQDIIRLAQTGDMLAFEEIYLKYSDASYSLALRITDNEALAQDIVQEAFIKVMNKIVDFKYKGSFAGWLRRIVVYETIDRIKSENKLHLVVENDFIEIESNDLFDYEWLSACIDLDIFLKQLTVTTRTVLLLHEVEGYKHKEIASFYGKSESFSKITLSRAYTSLRKIALKQEQQHAFK